MLTLDEWNELSEEEQQLRQDEKPDDPVEKKDQKTQPTADDLQKQLKELNDKITKADEEKKGIIGDLRHEREVRQRLETTLQELQMQNKRKEEFDINQVADDEYLTAGQVKKILAQQQQQGQQLTQQQQAQRSKENYVSDGERMSEATKKTSDDFPVPYEEAVDEFKRMAQNNPALWDAVHRESLKFNGKPAELAYRIALTSKTFIPKIKASARAELTAQLEKAGTIKRKLPPGGPPTVELDANLLSETDMMNLSDDALDALLKKTG